MGAFPLASILAMPATAQLSDRLGRRAPIFAGMILCGLGCAAMIFAGSLSAFVLARVAAGVGWAGVLVGGSIYATELAPAGRLAQALGIAGILTLVAMAVGPSLGELLVTRWSFEVLFAVAAALCAAGAGVAAALPGRTPTMAAAHRGRGLSFDRVLRLPLTVTFLVSAGFGAIVSFLADFTALAGAGGVAGFFNAYVALAILARLAGGSWSDRFGRLRVILPSLVGQALALAGLALLSSGWQLIPAGALFGFTHGMYYPALQALTVERVAPARRARTVASYNFAFSGGIAASALLNGLIAERFGYRAVYLVCASAALVSAALLASERGSRTAAD
jgi:MFS family permease